MSGSARQDPAPQTSGMAHWLGFLASGTASFVIDGGILKVLTAGLDVPVLPARVVSIGVAMVFGWLMHRRFTFRIAAPPSWGEFARFVGVAWSSALVNYLLFAAILYLRPAIEPLVAVFAAGLVAMVWSYLGLRFAAFRGKSSTRM
jgi:putative flippase GtrA